MQTAPSAFVRKNATSPGNIGSTIILPSRKFEKIMDFLEDKWGTKVVRRKNAFYQTADEDQIIAWLDNQENITILLADQKTGRCNTIQVKIDDIQLPMMIRVDHRIYGSVLYQLIRTSGGGVVRWFNKFYSSATGRVLAELVSSEEIRLFETEGLFGDSKVINLKSYAAIQVPREQYFHLLDFLAQETREEVVRAGNAFYRTKASELLNSILKSPATVSKSTLRELNTMILAELVSSEIVRLRGGGAKRVCDLALTHKVYRNHLYFCSSCQSFIRMPYRAKNHQWESEIHALMYISSSIVVSPISEKKAAKRGNEKFSPILYKFWGVERGKLAKEGRANCLVGARRLSLSSASIPAAGTTSLVRPRAVSATILLLAADITVDGKPVTAEEKRLALQRLNNEETTSNQQEEAIPPRGAAENPLDPALELSIEEGVGDGAVQISLPQQSEKQKIDDEELPELDIEV